MPVAELLRTMQCRGDHRHVQLMSGKAKTCEVYTERFREAVCVATRHDRNQTEMARSHVMNITKIIESMSTPHEAVDPWEIIYRDISCYDDVNGNQIKQKMAITERKLEMELFKKMKVYNEVSRREALANGQKIISTRWLDVNKVDQAKPDYYRARLAGRKINTETRLDLFAAAPPLESVRVVCPLCASHQDWKDAFVILSVDVKHV